MLRRSIIVCLILMSIMSLAACGAGAATPAPAGSSSTPAVSTSPTSAPVIVATTAPEPTQAVAPTETTAATEVASAANTPEALSGGGSSCLVGKWQFQDMSAYFSSVFARTNGAAQYVGQEGTILYTFGADGKAKIEAQNFKANLKITTSGVSIPMTINMMGSGTTDYALSDPNKITFSNVSTGDFKFSVSINGQETSAVTGDELAGLGMSADPKYSTFTYECSPDTLRYTPPLPNAQPVVLKRVSS